MALRRRGFTLIELLVSIGIMSVLGLALAVVLRQSMRLWHSGEARREAYEEAERVFRALREDVASIYTGRSEPGTTRAILLCHRQRPSQQQRLVFIRTIAAEPADPLSQLTGLALSDRHLDQRGDPLEAQQLRLMASGGLEEVQWLLDPRGSGRLYRARRSPVGGTGSLFYTPVPLDSLAARCQMMSDRVLHFGLQFWHETATSWNSALTVWDSTRSVAAFENLPERGSWQMYRNEGSIADSRDDVFPTQIRLTLILEDPIEGADTQLVGEISAREDRITLAEEDRFDPDGGYALIGQEWVKYSAARGTVLTIASQGRGQRGTQAQEHPAGTRVRTGRTFVKTLALPGFREDWGGR